MSQMKVTRERQEGPGGTTTVKTTSYESSSSSSQDYTPSYKSTIAPRVNIIQRTAYSGPQKGGSVYSKQMQQSYNAAPAMSSGAYAAMTNSGVVQVKDARKQEKNDMQDLNLRFASYIEKVRFLEAQNRRLAEELEKLKQKWGKETSAIKAMYQAELDEARKQLDEATKEKSRFEIRCASLEEQVEEFKNKNEEIKATRAADHEKIEKQNQQLSDYEAEINLLRRRLEVLENDKEKDRKEIARLTDALQRCRIDLDNETLNHIDAENRRQTLEEELEFLKEVHEQELKELSALAYRDTTTENREFWKNELGQALREIQTTYDDKLDSMRNEMESFYQMKVQELKTGATRQNMESIHSKEESKRLKSQLSDLRAKNADLEARNAQLERELMLIKQEFEDKEREWETESTELKSEVAKLRAEMEAILKELQDIMDTKLGLELEIAAYRKLLEGEENRAGMQSMVSNIMMGGSSSSSGGGYGGQGGDDDDQSLKVSQVVKGEMSAKTTYQRSAKGPVSVCECSADGKYICLENNSRKEEAIGGWRIRRVIDGRDGADISLDGNMRVRPGGKVKLYAGQKPMNAGRDDLSCDIGSWGIGANIQTKLVNTQGEDRATHVQKTTYSS